MILCHNTGSGQALLTRDDIDDNMRRACFCAVVFCRDWLRENIWRHGRRYTRDELLIAATGRALDPQPYLDYLTAKHGGKPQQQASKL